MTKVIGKSNNAARLNLEKAQEIRDAYAKGNWTMAELGQHYGVTRQAVHAIICGKSWRVP
jgi:DNA-binding XRE family transcriptional regulator